MIRSFHPYYLRSVFDAHLERKEVFCGRPEVFRSGTVITMQPKTEFLNGELFTEELTFPAAAPLFEAAVQRLCSLPEGDAADLCEALLERMEQIYNDDILLRSYNGYVTFPSARSYSAFLDATRSVCTGYERLASQGLQPLRCRKAAVYLRVMGMSAATRDFKYGMRTQDRKTWDDEIFDLEEKIIAEEPHYTVPSSELPQNQRALVADYWLRHREEYWARHRLLERNRSHADTFQRIVNSLGVAMLVVPLLFLLVCLIAGSVHSELTILVVLAFLGIGIGVYLFGFLRRRALRAVNEFEFQGVGQLDRVIPPVDSAPQSDV